MAAKNTFAAEVKADLYNRITSDGEYMELMGDSTKGDIVVTLWQYDVNSSATDDFANGVIKPTLQTGNGRWLRRDNYPLPRVITNSVSRSLDSSFQVSTIKIAHVFYTLQIAALLNTGTVFLEISPDNTNWTEVGRVSSGTLTLTIVSQLSCMVPVGYYVRLRTTGAATITYITGQETTY